MTWLTVVWSWLWANTAGNILASVMCGVAVWFWKIRPHLRRQAEHREAAEERHEQVEGWLAGVHERFDELTTPGQHAERQEFHGRLPDVEGRRD